jgi:sucrose phosphorylase
LCAHAILLAMKGVPGIYIHSLLGSRGWQAGVEITGVKRTINRQKFDETRLVADLAQPDNERAQIFGAFRRMLSARAAQPAFDPYGTQQVLCLHPAVFGLLRRAQNGGPPVVCLNNLSDATLRVDLIGLAEMSGPVWKDVLAEPAESGGWVWALAPYQTRWLTMGKP